MPIDPIHPITPAARTMPPIEPALASRRVTREEPREQGRGGSEGKRRRPGGAPAKTAPELPGPDDDAGTESRIDIRV